MARGAPSSVCHIPALDSRLTTARRARLNCIAHLLTQIPYDEVEHPPVKLPDRVRHADYSRAPVPPEMHVPKLY